MSLVSRYLLGFRGVDTLETGLFEKDDGTSWYRKPDGSEIEIGGGGGSLPATWTVDSHGNVVIVPDGASAIPPKAALTVQPVTSAGDAALRVNDEAGIRVASISGGGLVDAARGSFGGFGPIYGDPLAAEDQDSGNVIFEIKDGGGMNVYEADGSTVMLSVSATGAVSMPLLPTADPHVAGQLWNSAGTLKVSAG